MFLKIKKYNKSPQIRFNICKIQKYLMSHVLMICYLIFMNILIIKIKNKEHS